MQAKRILSLLLALALAALPTAARADRTPGRNLGGLTVDLRGGEVEYSGVERAGPLMNSLGAADCAVDVLPGEPVRLDLDRDGSPDIAYTPSLYALSISCDGAISVGDRYVLTLSKSALVQLSEQGNGDFYDSITFLLPPLRWEPSALTEQVLDLRGGSLTAEQGSFDPMFYTLEAFAQTGRITRSAVGANIWYDLDRDGVYDLCLHETGAGQGVLSLQADSALPESLSLSIGVAELEALRTMRAPTYAESLVFLLRAAPVLPFVDVAETDACYEAVYWAYFSEPPIARGIDETHFGPYSTVTRGQAVTFLWRAVHCPEPKTTDNPFVDVRESDYFYKAVLWANEYGITVGTDATHFTPDQTCSTAHIVTFLYRTMNQDEVRKGNDGWYQVAADWGNGWPNLGAGVGLAILPGVRCPRSAVVSYIYRTFGGTWSYWTGTEPEKH
ncbi:MAG: S-layer homology domain-containing protein [Oscillospiraceae bacterium]|nr:S-layer homology domain-containing protein [Oscillospiraceae bacterium]